ncbi:UDP-N-acetylglucosamine-peptide N-acetylglucosaminyltransferase [Lysobacter sp. N42]|uniref:O-linked N-acetylglucosamine transferase, SPINDLY family protein n=1 Tax=Lysobacter sp. N42 TaxID=2545719 RepID=UPI0010466C7E|nr:UDP-N-acetylglucosamine-peptide N-acetylglucosaminyltransferase [Lysobacter sp. N42]TCZ83424.1 UDP-N-acetylglucosamine-peptide N-acetylglucosaminyltransferase [Lysobacter sp. N42]
MDPRQQARAQVQRAPGDPIAWVLLSEAELDAGDARAGERAAARALAIAPGHPEALARLGRAQSMQGRLNEAADSLMRAATAAPGHPGILVWLGHALEDVRRVEEAAEAFARAHALLPQEPQVAAYLLAARRRLCDWRGLDALSRQVREAVRTRRASVEPFAFLSEDATPAEQLACARMRAAQLASLVRPMPPATLRGDGPLRLGFLSNGFGSHPTGLLTVALLEALRAHADVDVHLFALNPDDGGAIRARLASATTLHDVAARPHVAVAQAIRAAGIDILFDLRGWGGGGAPEVLAMRPAPLQVNWLAYPGTSGAPWIDYVLADRVVLPDALVPHFSEAVAWLPGCFQPSDTRRDIPPAPTRADCGLPDEGIVLCCFNNSYKLNPRSIDRALDVLARVPGSVLWLLSGPGRADERLRAHSAARGIDPSRLVFMPKQPHAAYLARLQRADLFLDTEPYNAHTTASDALWAGCPVLTRPGETFAARVAASLLHHLGMDELVVDSDASFVGHAVRLATTDGALAALRDRVAIARRHAVLFDMDGFARGFVDTVQRMAKRARAGLPPARIG